ncbi:RNA polymerase sigma-70 factor (ECF subfamily) [Lapillicoccus jejuensis]|uniref:RNA polymerase sigma-70 factor (ECF subfamily) n=1 Tax=Lapillicoccus jejuensis TaxID=402171 RepID=A0A542E1N9_9MICO|nr:RNA polymerase sigma-70 factor (ECF subfamily) [Lapillicoccus jejuensis]
MWGRARSGDGQAFAVVFDLHRDRVYVHALRMLGAPGDAEDVAASAFLELWRRRDAVRVVNGSVLPWLLVTTGNVARNTARARRRYRDFLARLPHSGDLAGEAARPGVSGSAAEARDAAEQALAGRELGVDPRLRDALRALPELDMTLLLLVGFEDLTVADAAAATGISPAAAKTRLHRARLRIRQQLADFPEDSTGTERIGAAR